MYKNTEDQEKPGEICGETGRRGRYAIADGPVVLLIVGDLTEATRRQWPTKRYVFLPARVCHLSRGHEEEARQQPSESDGSAASVSKYQGWRTQAFPWITFH